MVARPTQSGPWISDVRSLSQSELKEGKDYTLKLFNQGQTEFFNGGIIGVILFLNFKKT